jgi:hypothetical protein
MGDERQKSLLHMVSELFNAHAPCSKALEITIETYYTQIRHKNPLFTHNLSRTCCMGCTCATRTIYIAPFSQLPSHY